MILVDAGVLIDFLRTKDAKLDRLFRTEPVAVCGATRAEILAGARNPQDRQRLMQFLGTFQQVGTPEPLWDLAGETLATLYARGITVPFPDALVTTIAIENDIEVWARDPHFRIMQTALSRLKLYSEPP
ncbi:MAG TPA: PIN domain-containing protein [Gemmataceae bacterium]|jgi:predicted nucleic acid-binding protein